jgi:hypothetical protein
MDWRGKGTSGRVSCVDSQGSRAGVCICKTHKDFVLFDIYKFYKRKHNEYCMVSFTKLNNKKARTRWQGVRSHRKGAWGTLPSAPSPALQKHVKVKFLWGGVTEDRVSGFLGTMCHIHVHLRLFFGGTEGFQLTKQTLRCLSHSSSPLCSEYFGDGVLRPICLGWLEPQSSWSQPPST